MNTDFFVMNYHEAKDFVLIKLKKELKPTLYYHNYQHTIDVCEATENLAIMEGVDAESKLVLVTAALYHDTGFFWQYDHNEPLACEFARETLPRFEYTPSQIEEICQLIMATQMPHHPRNLLERIICDADLDYLGRSDFFITALRLHREWSENSNKKIPFKDWYLKQFDFVQHHAYFTASANKLRNERKSENLLQIQELLGLMKNNKGRKNEG